MREEPRIIMQCVLMLWQYPLLRFLGGFDNKAKRSGTYIVYANGDVARTKKFLFFNIYPKAQYLLKRPQFLEQ